MTGGMGEEGIGMRTGGMIGMEEVIGMVETGMGVIGMEGIEEGVTGMEEVETGTERTDMEEDPEGRDPPAPTTGSRDQGGITDPEAGATRDQDTKNIELEIRESEPNKTKPIPYLPLVWV